MPTAQLLPPPIRRSPDVRKQFLHRYKALPVTRIHGAGSARVEPNMDTFSIRPPQCSEDPIEAPPSCRA